MGIRQRFIPWLLACVMAAVGLWPTSPTAAPTSDQLTQLTARLQPAVVNIQVRNGGVAKPIKPPFRPGTPLSKYNRFFKDGSAATSRMVAAAGSGFIISADGLIVTNAHVLDGGRTIDVTMHDGRKFVADLIGRDQETDLAVLKVKTSRPLPFVKFDTSGTVKPGKWVVAIGNPFGLGGSVSVGVVSALGRDISQGRYDAFIQTDAAINQGNSGGPLFNTSGDVVGVNSAILSPSGNSVGIGFAIPADLAASVVRQLTTYGETRRGFLGVETQDITPDLAERFGLKSPAGALVTRVLPGTPAADTGLQRGDVVVHLGGKSVGNARALSRIVADMRPNQIVGVGLLRDRKPLGLQVTMGQLQETRLDVFDEDADKNPNPVPSDYKANAFPLGLVLVDTKDGSVGAKVVRVQADSRSHGLLQKGDVILEVEWNRVSSATQANKHIKRAIKGAPSQPVLLLIHRQGGFLYRAVGT